MRNIYLTSAIFLILMIICSTIPSGQGIYIERDAKTSLRWHAVLVSPSRPPPVTPVPHPPSPPDTPVPHPPPQLQGRKQPQVVGGWPVPRPPLLPHPPRPPAPHSLLEAEAKSETCYPNNNKLSPTSCGQMCKKNGFETKYSYYIERQDAKWECCCPH
ncbi:hypothetical protein BDA96_05G245500 [Sorghum bicolor]|uniref:Uncharacterized protein n=2 Tax=Sorghum bicolor TaxID=4558 RepID=A0A921R0M2_SORBI|nr:hypothetical protein BDA96_05G245500 [Sorghum bicolor]KXG29213.1 hypothetical protein SORBI_3005G227800 [Sorghum bicolor]